MKLITYVSTLILLLVPVSNVYSGFGGNTSVGFINSDLTREMEIDADTVNQLSGYYDLRERNTYIQITNTSDSTITIHVQVFQNDRECDELNFNDELTANDTVVYDMDNIVRNNGLEVPINLQNDSFGYVVVSIGDGSEILNRGEAIIGNFRIVDEDGYEYRTNMAGVDLISSSFPPTIYYQANFNTIDGANQADVVGYTYYYSTIEDPNTFSSTVRNLDVDLPYNIFIFDMDEEPLSCDQRAFTCGKVMNYGINEDYPASRGENLLCPGGGLADPRGGFITFEPTNINQNSLPNDLLSGMTVGLIGLNNGDGTGSMDYWIITDFLSNVSDIRLKHDINELHKLDNGIKLYSFKYKDHLDYSGNTYVGVMAQDLNQLGRIDAVIEMSNGYYAVNYNKLGLRMTTIEQWEEKGLDSVIINNSN